MRDVLGALVPYGFDLTSLTGTPFRGRIAGTVLHLRPDTCPSQPGPSLAGRLPNAARLAELIVCQACAPAKPWTDPDGLLLTLQRVAEEAKPLTANLERLPGLTPPPQRVETRWRSVDNAWLFLRQAERQSGSRADLAGPTARMREQTVQAITAAVERLRTPDSPVTLPAAALLTDLPAADVEAALRAAGPLAERLSALTDERAADVARVFRWSTFGRIHPLAKTSEAVDWQQWDAPVVNLLADLLQTGRGRIRRREAVAAARAVADQLADAWLPRIAATQARYASRPAVPVAVSGHAIAPNLDWLSVVRLVGGEDIAHRSADVVVPVPAVIAAAVDAGEAREWWDAPTVITGVRMVAGGPDAD